MMARRGDGIYLRGRTWSHRGERHAAKIAYSRVKRVGQPEVTELRSWGAHKRLTIKRA